MSIQERIEEVAEKIVALWQRGGIRSRAAIHEVLSECVEFQEPKSPWVLCSERMPPEKAFVVMKPIGGAPLFASTFDSTRYFDKAMIQAWMEIPPFTPPESELVRRFEKSLETRISDPHLREQAKIVLKEVQQEMANGK